ncbi:enoyl-CoA hydratase/isomerase family protein [Flavobacterium croceum]|uniref:Methylglutaconyl-CoA hydratase n=1 Tax=Flavobacterium croceum DSM 17960 TaxID=1121886 RepID=A0A2S4NBD4_9FLAO|nr:enoyl-CoA hydratase/isomerase family protein [Flavobacterium croceum]POS03024.1 methylglutaconyl-CoA hydratase [Flavobacterium croceum DSM 17960]
MSNLGTISVQKNDKVATITFFHPSGNSFPSVLLQKLTDAISQLSNDASVHCIVLQSTGKIFCSGASFDELLAIQDFDMGKKFFSGFAQVINAMRTCNKIIIGKVQGKAVGGGVGLASACDYTIAHIDSSIKLSEIAIGIGPFVIEPAVSRKIGLAAMSTLTLNPNQWYTASWAFEKGLFTKVFDTQEELDNYTDNFAQEFSNYNPEALTDIKRVLWENTSHWDKLLYERAALSGKLVLSDFTKNALKQFKKQ